MDLSDKAMQCTIIMHLRNSFHIACEGWLIYKPIISYNNQPAIDKIRNPLNTH